MKFKKEKNKQQKEEAVVNLTETIENSDALQSDKEDIVSANTTEEQNTADTSDDTAEKPIEKKKIPLFSKILLGIAAFSAIFYIIFLNSTQASDFFNKYISPIIRAILSYITTWIPFSIAEMLII